MQFEDEKPFDYKIFISKFRDKIAEDIAHSNYDDLMVYKQQVARRMAIEDLMQAVEQELEKRKSKYK